MEDSAPVRMAIRSRVPILLLTGFLGSGKTSLLARWLRSPEFAGAMVIVNELGEVGLDHRLLASASDAPVLLEGGCACCAASADPVATLERLFEDRLRRKIPAFSWVLIETSGMADPVPILAALRQSGIAATRYALAGIVATFDARRGPDQLARHPECRRQLAASQAIVITKADLADGGRIEASRHAILEVRPDARILTSARADLPARAVLAALREAPAPASAEADGSGHAVHSGSVTSAFLPLPPRLEWTMLKRVLSELMEDHRGAILRLKGVADIEGARGPQAVQASPDEGIDCIGLPLPADDPAPRLGLTIIAQGAPPAARIALACFAKIVEGGRQPALIPPLAASD